MNMMKCYEQRLIKSKFDINNSIILCDFEMQTKSTCLNLRSIDFYNEMTWLFIQVYVISYHLCAIKLPQIDVTLKIDSAL